MWHTQSQHLKLASPASDACSHTDFWKSTLQLGGACERRLRGAMHATANAQWALVHRSTMAVSADCGSPKSAQLQLRIPLAARDTLPN
jgi:hypothetical protein